ncbi:MAG: hypothetical protein JW993_09140 [Sedimentisphaerales bacterium]|nr:hypothetical protein [Sedimentisphaerales bacterium]
MAIGAAVLILGWMTASVQANTGAGIGIKVGAQTLDSPIDGQETTRVRVEAEIASALLADEHADFFLSVGGSPLGSYDIADIYEIDGALYEDYFSGDYSVIDVRLGARLYPFGQDAQIRPHVGGGLGYYWFLDSYDDEYYVTTEDPFFPGSLITYADYASDTDTLADGFFPFITAGVSVPVTSGVELLFEFEYDFGKDDGGFDLGGPIYMFGARIRL